MTKSDCSRRSCRVGSPMSNRIPGSRGAVFSPVISCDEVYPPSLNLTHGYLSGFCRYGSHIAAPYSNCDLTSVG